MKEIPKIIAQTDKSASFYMSKAGDWNEAKARRVYLTTQGVIATTDPVIVNGEKVRFTERALRQAAKSMGPGFPILAQPRGKPVGRVTKSWVEGGNLFVRIGLFKPETTREKEIVSEIKSGSFQGLSIAGSSQT